MVSITKRLLYRYRDLEWKAERAAETISECNAIMTRLQGYSDAPAVQSGGNKREDLLIACIERKQKAEEAINFIRMIDGAMAKLTDNERDLLTIFYIDRMGIRAIMSRERIGKSRAYDKVRSALYHLDGLLF